MRWPTRFFLGCAAFVVLGNAAAPDRASAVQELPQGPVTAVWPFAACDVARHQFIIDASATDMCDGDGRLVGPGWWWRSWPGLVNGGQHYMTLNDNPGSVPDETTASTFYPTIAVPGLYDVWASWRTTHNRATEAPYYIYADDGETYRMVVDQSSNSDGFRAVKLGTFFFTKHSRGKSLVTLTNKEGNHSKGSDAVFIKYVGPTAPTGLAASDGKTLTKIVLTWKGVPGATAYQIFRGATAVQAEAVRVGVTADGATSTFTDVGLQPGSEYHYWVRAVGALNRKSQFSNRDVGSTGVRPETPQNVSASDGLAAHSITISWARAAGATSYKVYRADSVDGPKTRIALGLTGLKYVDAGRPAGRTYYYFVKARNAAAESYFSAPDVGSTSN